MRQAPLTDDDRAADGRARKMIRAFMVAAARDPRTTRGDVLRAAISVLLTSARNLGATRTQLVALVDLEAATLLEATEAQLAAMGVEHVDYAALAGGDGGHAA